MPHDAPQGRQLLGGIGPLAAPLHLIMDRAYEDNETRQLALDFGFIPVVPPKSNRLEPWQYDQAMYRKRNEIDRLFADSRASGASSRASRSSTRSFLAFSTSPYRRRVAIVSTRPCRRSLWQQ